MRRKKTLKIFKPRWEVRTRPLDENYTTPSSTHSKHFSHKRAAREASYMNCVRNVFGYTRWTYYVHDTRED